MKNVYTIALAMLSLSAVSVSALFQYEPEDALRGMRGLGALKVVVNIQGNAMNNDEYSAAFESLVRDQLQDGGVSVLEEGIKSDRAPVLMVNSFGVANAQKEWGMVFVGIELYAPATLQHNEEVVPGLTWYRYFVLSNKSSEIPEKIGSKLDAILADFISSYQSANP